MPTNNVPVPLIHFRTMDLMARILNGSLTRAVAVISGRSLDGLRGQRPTGSLNMVVYNR